MSVTRWLALTGGHVHVLGGETPVDIDLIANSLSRLARFNGHTSRFYSVAEHSIYCSMLVPEEDALEALLHDAGEAYLGDLAGPIRHWLLDNNQNGFERLVGHVEQAVREHFNLRPYLPQSVIDADEILLGSEYKELMTDAPAMSCKSSSKARLMVRKGARLFPTPNCARQHFIRRFYELTAGGGRSMADEAVAQARSSFRGHPIIYTDKGWQYEDTRAPIPAGGGEVRPCVKCGSGKWSGDGHADECLGKLPGVSNACCGHGDPSTAYVVFENGVVLRGFEVSEKYGEGNG